MSVERSGSRLSQDLSRTLSAEVILRLSKLGISREILPNTYFNNSVKEKKLLLYVQNFCRQFSYLYQDRKTPFLTAENETGIQKVVCTTIRPTAMQLVELEDWAGCAEFVAEFLKLELLENPTVVPDRLLSPGIVLKRRKANCFEYSTVLCSILIGVGYDAYVVNGYATRDICFDNTDREDCPLQQEEEEKVEVIEEKRFNKYEIKGVKDSLRSKFEEKLEKRRSNAAKALRDEERRRELAEVAEASKPLHDSLYGQRVHSWVLVKSGKHEVGSDFFIEPLTGWSVSLNSDKYLGIESVWNNENYWLNMQHCKDGVNGLFYDFTDVGMWECFLPYIPLTLPTPNDSEEAMENIDLPPLLQEKLDLPASWALPLEITAKNILSRFPSGKKTKIYKFTKLERFNLFEMKDGIVLRICRYKTWDRKDLETVEEYFNARADQLYRKIHNHNNGMVTEYYKPGQVNALREHTYKANNLSPQADRTLVFYQENRADGLARRQVTEEELIDYYEGRLDYLAHRHTWFGLRIKKFGPLATTQKTISKILEKYNRDDSKQANDDVAEVIYNIADLKIKVIYHRQEDKIASSWREFSKPKDTGRREYQSDFTLDAMKEFQADPDTKPLSRLEAFLILYDFTKREAQTLNRIRDDEAELQGLLNEREQEHSTCSMDISPYNVACSDTIKRARLQKLQQDLHDRQSQEMEQDFLKPYLTQLDVATAQLSTRQSQLVMENCLTDCKQQLLEKFNIIRTRHEEESRKLKEVQDYLQQNSAIMTEEEQKQYDKKCEKLLFKLKVLEFRLMQHKESAPQKYLALEKKLKNDPRLSLTMTP